MSAQTLNISLPKKLVQEADKLAKDEYRSRSELIREAIRVYIKEKQEWEKIFSEGEKKAKKLGVKSEGEVNKIVSEYRRGE